MLAALLIIGQPIGTKPFKRLSRLISDHCEMIAEYLSRRSAVASLSELDDRALRGIGLERSQIEAAVYGLVRLGKPGRR